MSYFEAFILAVVQGMTEFLPISSSAHLIFPSQLLGWQDQGVAFDVALHVGTLLAVTIYYRKTLLALAISGGSSALHRKMNHDLYLLIWLIFATIPAVIFGFLIEKVFEWEFRSILIIASTTLVFGLLLGWADKKGKRIKMISDIGWQGAWGIGLAQALALIPGTSRSGVTMTALLMAGYDRKTSADLSFLMSIPIIVAAGGLKGLDLYMSDITVDWGMMLLGMGLAFVCAYSCIHLFIQFVEKVGMTPFVIYRLLLSAALFAVYFYVP